MLTCFEYGYYTTLEQVMEYGSLSGQVGEFVGCSAAVVPLELFQGHFGGNLFDLWAF